MTPIALFLALWVTLVIAPDTPTGRFLHRVMIDVPAKFFNRATRGHVLLVIIMLGLAAALAWFGGADGLRFFGMTVPDVAAWSAMFEISAYLDAIAAIVAASSALRVGAVRVRLGAASRPKSRRARGTSRPRDSRRQSHNVPANDDDCDGRLAFAS
ncbi:hypothetical protein FHS31_001509 [Sphingomonas vulcanisoli]|uniref:Uncharacterized protein n=1 Tax=Sphingomonas vulcanisoli TaxID=1658060 RepID=A0ABX0TQU4_9SPHN|nr:hypothetical protein [Sphingomonas vulcanisoli]NIJ07899.1 hypothetical protein [Sphingomonas vulcanisoli]